MFDRSIGEQLYLWKLLLLLLVLLLVLKGDAYDGDTGLLKEEL